MALVVNPPPNAEDARDTGSITGPGSFLGGGNGNPLQNLAWKNPTDKRAWQATTHGVAESDVTKH